ncbi:MAG: RDD family protein [Flavobacterium sp.]|uniref:RDD family protein n=1 Tax=Flavobacterium sp. TaxID=239 RepID=UPI001B05CF8B|nr:RDD family protein [Flavobacterium sp.]MBO9585165.1 RDD family protein [Flavobacterium sp.]
MKKIIFILSLFFSLWGISIAFFFVFFNPTDITEFSNFIVFSSKPYHFSGFDIYIITERTNEYSYRSTSIAFLTLFFYLSFLAGSIIYYFSQYKDSKLLLFNYALIFLDGIIKICSFFLHFHTIQFGIYSIIYILLSIAYIFISYQFITKHLNINAEDNNLENASNYKRLLNLIIDSFIIIIIVYGFITYAIQNNQETSIFKYFKITFGVKFGILAFFSVIKFIYYLLFESVFKSTPAKFITACYITDENGNPPTFLMILKRTLFRFIPFESLSFLMGKNLHDDYTDTYVINKKTDFKTEKKYLQTLSICFLIMLVIYFYNLSTRHHF